MFFSFGLTPPCNASGLTFTLQEHWTVKKLIYKVYDDGTTTMSTHERKQASESSMLLSIPLCSKLQSSVTDTEDKKQKIMQERYRRRGDEEYRQLTILISKEKKNAEYAWRRTGASRTLKPRQKEQAHTFSYARRIVWRTRSQSCPFCRDSLKRVDSRDLWVYTDRGDVIDMATVMRENLEGF
ncbi:sphingolipid delta(4)-desaturase DES1-like [Hibiscus syriacus]|uniref:Sphingolipid delta(4)-desaturase DES1-like n=1 Tax=Hibiscus syriacus TaxID=106335 RepID=A0A6A3BPX1_HIBSY|nr:sphingolipid delta(4)-desaturase DES1-like [Hibiscus syriacus]